MADVSTPMYVRGPFRKFVERFCDHIGVRWRTYQVLVGDNWYQQRVDQVILPDKVTLSEGAYFCRHPKMDRWWGIHGYELMASGEGPFGIVEWGFKKDVVLGLQQAPAWCNRSSEICFEGYPAGATVAVRNLQGVCFVTPGIPGQCRFSTWVLQCGLAAALRLPRRS